MCVRLRLYIIYPGLISDVYYYFQVCITRDRKYLSALFVCQYHHEPTLSTACNNLCLRLQNMYEDFSVNVSMYFRGSI